MTFCRLCISLYFFLMNGKKNTKSGVSCIVVHKNNDLSDKNKAFLQYYK